MKSQWLKSGNNYFIRETSVLQETLEPAIYKLSCTATGEIFLERTMDKFEMPSKMYGFEATFVDRMIKTYHAIEDNLGILLNGLKGTGKTITAKAISNKIEMPVIIVTHPFSGIPEFINDIQQEIIVFFDEYEKMYKYPDNDTNILTIMDGVLDNGYKRMFLLTTNKLDVNENLLQRPGRIRYCHTFKDLNETCIREIVDDLLVKKERTDSVVKFISELDIITVDIVKAVVNEVNIHDEDPLEFLNIFNVKKVEETYNIYKISLENGMQLESLEYTKAKCSHAYANEDFIGETLVINNSNKGTIVQAINHDIVVVEQKMGGNTYKTMYRIETVYFVHRSFGKHR